MNLLVYMLSQDSLIWKIHSLKLAFCVIWKGILVFPKEQDLCLYEEIHTLFSVKWRGAPPRDWIPSSNGLPFYLLLLQLKGKNETSVCWEMQLSRCNSICGALYHGNHLANSKPGRVHNCIGWQRTSSPLRINFSLSRKGIEKDFHSEQVPADAGRIVQKDCASKQYLISP